MISSNTPLLSRPWCAHKKTNTTPILNPPPIEDDRFSQMVDHEYPQSDGTPCKADTFTITILAPNGVIWRQIRAPTAQITLRRKRRSPQQVADRKPLFLSSSHDTQPWRREPPGPCGDAKRRQPEGAEDRRSRSAPRGKTS